MTYKIPAIFFLVVSTLAYGEEPASSVSFRTQIAPILYQQCIACHGARRAEGGYRVDKYSELFKVGDSGETPIEKGKASSAELYLRLISDDESTRMPLDAHPLSTEQIALIRNWIDTGASFDGDDIADPLSLLIPAPQYDDPPATYPNTVPITAVAFNDDGSQLLVSGYHEVVVWDYQQKKIIRRIRNLPQRIHAIAIAKDRNTIAIGGGEPGVRGEVRVIDFETGSLVGVVARSEDIVMDLAFRPNTDQLAVAIADGTIRIVECETMKLVKKIASHAGQVNAIAWSEDGELLASASEDHSTKVFRGDHFELIASYSGDGSPVKAVGINSEKTEIVSLGSEKKLHRWKLEDAKNLSHVELVNAGIRGRWLNNQMMIAGKDGGVVVVDPVANQKLKIFEGHRDWATSICWTQSQAMKDKKYVAAGYFDGIVKIWGFEDGQLLHQWSGNP